MACQDSVDQIKNQTKLCSSAAIVMARTAADRELQFARAVPLCSFRTGRAFVFVSYIVSAVAYLTDVIT